MDWWVLDIALFSSNLRGQLLPRHTPVGCSGLVGCVMFSIYAQILGSNPNAIYIAGMFQPEIEDDSGVGRSFLYGTPFMPLSEGYFISHHISVPSEIARVI